MRVLVVEDDAELARILKAGLEEHHIATALAGTYEAGLEQAGHGTYDVILLDVLLPGGSGFDLCATLRRRGNLTPILMLTAKDAVDDRVRGLEAGADDYLTKPFAFRELLARVGALARRRPTILPEVGRWADLEVDLAARRVRRGDTPIELTAKEFALLEVLIANAGAVVGRAAITSYVWDDNHDPFANVLEVLVRRLRRKVDDGFEPPLIHTVRGVGYRFGL